MAFDEADYRKRVLQPYTRVKLGVLQAALRELEQDTSVKVPSGLDLAEFYDLSAGLSDSEIRARVTASASAIAKTVTNPAFKGAGKNLLALHERIAARNPDLMTESFWRQILARRQARAREALEEFGRGAAAELRVLGVVTATRLRQLARASGVADAVPDSELARVVSGGGIVVVGELPAVSAPPQLLKEVAEGLKRTSCRSVLSAIFIRVGEPQSFAILDGFRPTSGTQSLTVKGVAEAHQHTERLPDTDENNAIGKILAAIRSAIMSDADLHAFVVGHFIEHGRQLLKEFPLHGMALKAFVDRTGLDCTDAARVLQSLSEGAGPQRSWPAVQSLVAEGTLKEARRLYEALCAEVGASSSDERDKAQRTLEGAERRVAELRSEAERAVGRGDLETARRALDQALTMCIDDESLADTARALPPAAPLKLVAAPSEDGRQVRVTWEPGFGSTGDVEYVVIRRLHGAPKNNQDGTPLGPLTKATTFVDERPPVAVDVHYGVAATRGGGFSPVSTTQVVVLPPATGLRTSSDLTSVTLRWTTPPEASSIEVLQMSPDGRTEQLRLGAHSGAISQHLATGQTYNYLVTALYAAPSGTPLRSTTARTTGTPRGEAKAVGAFTVCQGVADGEIGIEAGWTAVEGYPVEIWHYPQRPGWALRSRQPMSVIRTHGTQLAGRSAIDATRRERVHGPTVAGLRYYVAITRDGDEGIVGQIQPFGTCPPVTNARAERFGDEVVLSWDWPGPEYQVRVAWRAATGDGERTLALSEYRSQGGCRIRTGTGGGAFRLSTVAGDGQQAWTSAETSLKVSGTSAAVRYDVAFHKRLFGSPTSATLTFDTEGVSEPVGVVVVGHHGKTMPFDADSGTVLTRTTVAPGTGQAIEVALTRGKGTVWVRAFPTTTGVRLIDPSPQRMRSE